MCPDDQEMGGGTPPSEQGRPPDPSRPETGGTGPAGEGLAGAGGRERREMTPSSMASGGSMDLPSEDRPPARPIQEREVKVLNIFQYEEKSEYTFVLLQDGRGRKLPIWIGPEQAQAIYIALRKEQYDFHRPLTHDLLKNIVEKLGGRIERLTIDDMWQDTFYARLVLNVGDRAVDIDCRPSDGIAVALRAQAPIYVSEEVLDSCRLQED